MPTINRTIESIKRRLPSPNFTPSPAPAHNPSTQRDQMKLALAVSSMKNHMTDEGWQIMQGLEQQNYELMGHGIGESLTDVKQILELKAPISTLFLQDIREWDRKKDFRDPQAYFKNYKELKNRDDIFKVTILKDAHQRPDYHKQFFDDIGCHAWVIYYDKRIVQHLAPYIRPEHVIQTTHSIDPGLVPEFVAEGRKNKALLSGASTHEVYPLRCLIEDYKKREIAASVEIKKHPGYHRSGCETSEYLKILSGYKVAICTSSIYGYCLRKIIEATACGCHVFTDLPVDSVQHHSLENNITRIGCSTSPKELEFMIQKACKNYDEDKQKENAKLSQEYFHYLAVTKRLSNSIETLRKKY